MLMKTALKIIVTVAASLVVLRLIQMAVEFFIDKFVDPYSSTDIL